MSISNPSVSAFLSTSLRRTPVLLKVRSAISPRLRLFPARGLPKWRKIISTSLPRSFLRRAQSGNFSAGVNRSIHLLSVGRLTPYHRAICSLVDAKRISMHWPSLFGQQHTARTRRAKTRSKNMALILKWCVATRRQRHTKDSLFRLRRFVVPATAGFFSIVFTGPVWWVADLGLLGLSHNKGGWLNNVRKVEATENWQKMRLR